MEIWTSLHLAFIGLLALSGFHRLGLTLLYLRESLRPQSSPDLNTGPGDRLPFVTVQLPLFNERYVAMRLLDHVQALDYPRDRLEIQVLDDSDDETRPLVGDRIRHLLASGLDIVHLTRENREGFKAGALAAAFARSRGDFFLLLDADFMPDPDFLLRLIPSFDDPAVGAVQARWTFVNRDYSLLTRLQALFLDGHFVIEHRARQSIGAFFNFNGSGGILRRSAIEVSGGWQSDTLTEDLDLSYRMQLAGYRFVFRADVVCPSQLPYRFSEFKCQQFRWVKGSLQTARKLMGRLAGSRFPWLTRVEAGLHLITNLVYPLMLGTFLSWIPIFWSGTSLPRTVTVGLGSAGLISLTTFYAVAHLSQRLSLLELIPLVPTALSVAAGLTVSNTRAVIEGLGSSTGTFERTPKLTPGEVSDSRSYRPAGSTGVTGLTGLIEILLAAYLLFGVSLALQDEGRGAVIFLALFGAGVLVSGISSLSEIADRGTLSPPPSNLLPTGETKTGSVSPDPILPSEGRKIQDA